MAHENEWFVEESDPDWARQWNGYFYAKRALIRELRAKDVVVRGWANAPPDIDPRAQRGRQPHEAVPASAPEVRPHRGPRTAIVLLIVLGFLSLAGGGLALAIHSQQNPQALPNAAPTSTAHPAEHNSAPDVHVQYRADVRAKSAGLAKGQDSDLDAAGDSVCAAFANGESVAEQGTVMSADGLSSRDAAVLIVIAVKDLCPQYEDQIND